MTKLKIGGGVVEVVEAVMDEYGRYESDKETIYIRTGLKGLTKARTQLHEVIHAIWHEYDMPTENEETCVRRLESGLASFFMDNPTYGKKLVAELVKGATSRN